MFTPVDFLCSVTPFSFSTGENWKLIQNSVNSDQETGTVPLLLPFFFASFLSSTRFRKQTHLSEELFICLHRGQHTKTQYSTLFSACLRTLELLFIWTNRQQSKFMKTTGSAALESFTWLAHFNNSLFGRCSRLYWPSAHKKSSFTVKLCLHSSCNCKLRLPSSTIDTNCCRRWKFKQETLSVCVWTETYHWPTVSLFSCLLSWAKYNESNCKQSCSITTNSWPLKFHMAVCVRVNCITYFQDMIVCVSIDCKRGQDRCDYYSLQAEKFKLLLI